MLSAPGTGSCCVESQVTLPKGSKQVKRISWANEICSNPAVVWIMLSAPGTGRGCVESQVTLPKGSKQVKRISWANEICSNPAVVWIMLSAPGTGRCCVESQVTLPKGSKQVKRISWANENCSNPADASMRSERLKGYATMPLTSRLVVLRRSISSTQLPLRSQPPPKPPMI